MKKSLIIAFLFFAAALAALPLAFRRVSREKENIFITEEPLIGSPEAASGVTLDVTSCRGHLQWNTAYTIGSGKAAESVCGFSYRQAVSRPYPVVQTSPATICFHLSAVNFGTAVAGRPSGSGQNIYAFAGEDKVDAEGLPFPEIIRAAAERTEAWEKHLEEVRIGDYYEVYPVANFYVEQGGGWLADGEELPVWFRMSMRSPEGGNEYFTDLFHISTGEDRIEVTVAKDKEGDLIDVRCKSDDGGVDVWNVTAFGRAGCYYTFHCEQGGERTDRGENRGIFYFPYTQERNTCFIETADIRRVCGLPEGLYPVEMLWDEEGGRLYLAGMGETDYILAVYAVEGEIPVLLQQIPVLPGQKGADGQTKYPEWGRMTEEDGGILMTWEDNSFSFVAKEDGACRLWCSGSFPADGQERDWDMEQAQRLEKCEGFPYANACIFDGERLVLGTMPNRYNMDSFVSVYREDGLSYCGFYGHSQSADADEKLWDGRSAAGFWGTLRMRFRADGGTE